MDMVKLSKQTAEVQMEVASILDHNKTTTFNRAFVLAKLKLIPDAWSEENKKLRDEIDMPKSIMRFDRNKNRLNDICISISHNEELRRTKRNILVLIMSVTTRCFQNIVVGL